MPEEIPLTQGKACQQALQQQMQVIQSRLSTLEEQTENQLMMAVEDIIATFISLYETGATTAAAVAYLASSPMILFVIISFLAPEAYRELMKIIQQLAPFSIMEIVMKIIEEKLQIPPFGATVDQALNQAQAAINSAISEVEAGILAGLSPQELIQLAQVLEESKLASEALGNIFTSQANLTVCGTISSVYGVPE